MPKLFFILHVHVSKLIIQVNITLMNASTINGTLALTWLMNTKCDLFSHFLCVLGQKEAGHSVSWSLGSSRDNWQVYLVLHLLNVVESTCKDLNLIVIAFLKYQAYLNMQLNLI